MLRMLVYGPVHRFLLLLVNNPVYSRPFPPDDFLQCNIDLILKRLLRRE